MATYSQLTANLVKEMETIVGAKNMTIDPFEMEKRGYLYLVVQPGIRTD